MCKICVEEGRMTQAELDEANANQTDQADFAAARAGLDPAAFLASLMSDGPEQDPGVEAQEALDETARLLLDFVAEEDEKYGAPDDAMEMAEACERDAGRLMYTCKPTTIAIALAVLTRRYRALLDQWAELYAKAMIGDDDSIDLDAAKTAEAREAVTRATADPEHKTGMYL